MNSAVSQPRKGTVLVTGADGFIGSGLVPYLVDREFSVRAAVRRLPKTANKSNSEYVLVGDLGEEVEWAPLLRGVESVVHLAGIAHKSAPDSSIYDLVIRRATARLVQAARAANVKRFIFISSIAAQAGSAVAHAINETDNAQPTDFYGRAKLAAEIAISNSGLSYTILRPVLVYGAGARGNMAALMRLAATNIPLPFGSITARRSLLARENLLDAIRFSLCDDRALNETFLVADRDAFPLPEIISILRRGIGRPPLMFSTPPALLRAAAMMFGQSEKWDRIGTDLVADTSKLERAGWAPTLTTEAGLTAMVRAHFPYR